jgi:hypothetical protein
LKILDKYANNEVQFYSPEKEELWMMKCDHCGQPLNTRVCPSCKGETLQESAFCQQCGARLENVSEKAASATVAEDDFSKRILCSDGTCIGIINEQGFCKVCGKRYEG